MPASQPVSFLSRIPPEIVLPLWVVLIGFAVSILTTQIRAAFPEPKRPGARRLLHYLYPSLLGVFLALATPSGILSVHWSIQLALGVVAHRVSRPLYAAYRVRLRQQFGLDLPGAPKARRNPGRKKRTNDGNRRFTS